jgi:signal transduction histidine kinase/CheY-like chemotaxis protein/HPt (histidine-containing phosphotransfer) domain-containing protein
MSISVHFPGSTEMHGRVNAHNWSTSPLGPVEHWSHSLKTLVGTVLASRYPMILSWGPQYTQIYNDGYSELIGRKHPDDLGADLRKSLEEGWDVLGPLVDSAIETGVATWIPALQLLLERHGYREESYFSVSHAPAMDDDGSKTGMLAICNEVTQQVIDERRLGLMRDISIESENHRDFETITARLLDVVSTNALDVPFISLFLNHDDDLRHAAGSNDAVLRDPSFWKSIGLCNGVASVLRIPADADFTGGPWGDAVQQAIAQPLAPPNTSSPIGMIVYGVSPNRALDTTYRSFFDTLTRQIAVSIGNVIAYQQERERVFALQELDRVKTAFFNNMSHEMRTPLNAIVGGSTLLAGTPLDATQIEYMQMIQTSSNHLLSIINDFLDYAKLDARKVEYHQASFEIRTWLTDTIDLVSVRAQEKSLELRCHVDDSVPRFGMGDEGRLRQVVLNLLSNAVKFTHSGSVSIYASHSGETLCFQVSDTGEGIPPDRIESVFEAFSQATSSVSTGTGLGLSITRSLVEGMGGSVEVTSTLGAGSTFIVNIPVARTDTPPVVAPTDDYDTTFATRHPHHILVAEDHPVNQKVITALLGRLGYSVDIADDGIQAVEMVLRNDYDLVLMDVQMPKLDGLTAARQIADALPAPQRPRVVALTANARHEDREQALAAGMSGYMTKPITMPVLARTLVGDAAPTPAQPQLTGEIVNLTRLNGLATTGHDFIAQLIDIYISSTAELIDLTEAALIEGRSNDVDMALHRLKGSSTTIGADRLAAMCSNQRFDDHLDITRLRHEFTQVRTALERQRATYSP